MSNDSDPKSVTPPDPAREATSETPPENFTGEGTGKRRALRQIILLCLLGLMLLALVYDYRVARPNVDKAYEQIAKLNDTMNATSDPVATLSTHIHKEIGRNPARTYTDGLYRIEVFSWTAGLPFRTHDLYAVYVPNGNDLVFMRHYKFQLPDNELSPQRTRTSDEDSPELSDTDDLGGPMGGPPPLGEPPMGGPGVGGPRDPGRASVGPGPDGPPADGPSGVQGRPRRPAAEDTNADPGTEAALPSEGLPGVEAPASAPSDVDPNELNTKQAAEAATATDPSPPSEPAASEATEPAAGEAKPGDA